MCLLELISQVPFEGLITYKVEVILKEKDSPYNDYYSQKYGDTIKIYYAANGNQRTDYLNSGKRGMDWRIYIHEKNTEYAKWHNMDTVFYFDAYQLATELQEFKKGDKRKILGKKCKSIVSKAYEPNGDETIVQKFYYSGKEYADPLIFEKYRDGYLDKIYALSKSHFRRRELDLKYIYFIIEAVEIKEQKLPPELFSIPKDKIMVSY